MKKDIEKKAWLGITPTELALTINTYLHDLEYMRYMTLNFTIRKDGRFFNLILIASCVALSKRQIIVAVDDILTTTRIGVAK